jgi:hypothetical protein
VKRISDNSGKVIAMVISKDYEPKIEHNFLTSSEDELQIATMYKRHFSEIPRHFHPKQERQVLNTSEVIIIRKGTMVAHIFDESHKLLESLTLFVGDALILLAGGHGFDCSEDCSFLEIKQGPFDHSKDKMHF